ncbi:EAL domain-containing protein [Bacillus sp. FJAT-27245]|uniref:EAL domain-containing protein n=1 Tax=Bacillus sp. FJAT-27245 TaxID=1684144 RepID=UPI0006A7D4F2|nr:EAL domain-containing protein [Bacillus sp. FJAT-27245]
MNSTEKINILLVDDRPENLLAMEAIIEQDDYTIIKAFSGEEALKYLLKYDFALILLDVQMPELDGFDTAKIIKAREKTKNVPILFITANNLDTEYIFKGYSVGAIDYILKPFDPFLLKAKVNGFVEIYRLNQQLLQQSMRLKEKTLELQEINLELENSTSKLRKSEALANVISETSLDTMINIDESGSILKVNPAIYHMFGYDEHEVLGKNISLLFSFQESCRYINQILKAIDRFETIIGNENNKEITASRKDGTQFPVEIQIGKRLVQGDCIVAVTIRDITNKKEYEKTLAHMAYHDWLTDLPNRRYFNNHLPELIKEAKQSNEQLALLYIDMDSLKFVNDSLGHIIGDKVIREFSERLKKLVKKEDFIARIGGDEFNIILHKTPREKAIEIAETILENFSSPLYVDTYELFITACIGISIFPFDGEDALTLMKNADAALYRAKQQGNHKYKMFHSGINMQSYRSFVLRNDLRKAIVRNELRLVYQPRIDIASGMVTSAEALLRWKHPDWGMISPQEFIPLAEESGQIVEIGNWVLQAVCDQIKRWKEAGLPTVRVAVNFSTQQFLQKDLVKTVAHILRERELSPSMLEVEITETVIMGNEPAVIKTLSELREIGIWISIDDFGTGYSSLSYLRSLPVQSLKIDRSFITDASNCIPLISTIISLAKSMELAVVAEGVETEEHLNILRELNCDEFQGYLVSPPVFPNEFESFLINNEPVINHLGLIEPVTEKKQDKTVQISKLSEKQSSDLNKDILTAALSRTRDLYMISAREMDVFELLVEGLSNKEISERLFISEHTVKNHITRIFQKLTVNDRLQAMAKVYQACIEEEKSHQLH